MVLPAEGPNVRLVRESTIFFPGDSRITSTFPGSTHVHQANIWSLGQKHWDRVCLKQMFHRVFDYGVGWHCKNCRLEHMGTIYSLFASSTQFSLLIRGTMFFTTQFPTFLLAGLRKSPADE